jgi:hypothetical protein
MNAALIAELLLKGLAAVQQYALLLEKSRAEGRDVSRAELDALFSDDDIARAALQAAIEARK